jgi:predicted ribosome quality control (RQC) complex YloA/Tae2 family protein
MLTKTINIASLQEPVNYSIGKNAKDNFDIIDSADQNDLWFHIHNEPSCHVIAHIPNINLNKKQLRQIITQGAVLCKSNSKFKSDKNIEVIYTKIKDVVKTDILGSVIANNTKNISI